MCVSIYARRWKPAFCKACPCKKSARIVSRQARRARQVADAPNADTGDMGLSATCTYGNEEVEPYNLEASVRRVCDCSEERSDERKELSRL